MPDFVPDDMEEYVRRANHIDDVMNAIDGEDVEDNMVQLAEWTISTANAMLVTGKIQPQEVASSVTGLVAGILAEWYAQTEYEIDDGQEGN